jgi:hypothetical protein
MNINIKITDAKPKKRRGVKSVEGEISIGNFKEILHIPIEWWSIDDYIKQWQEGISRLKYHDKSCFVVSIYNPKVKPFVILWVLYKIANKIHVQNHWFFGEIYAERIGSREVTVESCYDFIPERGSLYTEDGYKISEWVVEWK